MSKQIRWSKELVLDKIIECESNGVSLKNGSIRKTHNKLYGAAMRYYGSWSEAVKEAGFEYFCYGENKMYVVGDTKYIIAYRKGVEQHVAVDIDFNPPSRVFVDNTKGYPQVTINRKAIPLSCYIYGKTKENKFVPVYVVDKYI